MKGNITYSSRDAKKPMASIQISKAGDANGLEINEEITLMVTGIVKSIDSPREDIDYGPEGGKTRMRPGCIELEITSMSVGDIADETEE